MNVRGHPFTDASGDHWRVVDFRFEPGGRKRRTTLGADAAEARAFIPRDWSGEPRDVLVYRFGPASTRCSERDFLQSQLTWAHRATATPLERMQPMHPRTT